MLTDLAHELGAQGIEVALARVESSISELWERAGTLEVVRTPVFHTTSEAVETVRRGPARD